MNLRYVDFASVASGWKLAVLGPEPEGGRMVKSRSTI